MPKNPQPKGAVRVFYSYSHKDEKLRDLLETHLALLRRRKVISGWHDRRIGAGDEWAGQIDEHMKSADIILLLVSANFLASNYCYDIELKLAMKRHKAREARVVPVILRPCEMTGASFLKLQALPRDGRPVTTWKNKDEAFKDIASGIRLVAEELKAKRRVAFTPDASNTDDAPTTAPPKVVATLIPRPPVVGFVARRDKEGRDIVGLLKEELAPDKSRLIAIWAPPGSGKTTLAAEVARQLRNEYGQCLAWVSALGRIEFGLQTLLDNIATQLGRADLRRSAPDPKAEQVRALLADSPSLVVLDNFESIEPGEQARCIEFLAVGTDCSALITTRWHVNYDAVKNVGLAAMEMDDAREFWRRLVEQSGRPAAFDGLDADEIIRHCETNPLVIQWVVGQIKLAQRPKDALDYLSQGQGDAAERVFDRSFNLPQLGDDGRAALLALSLFTPDASRGSLAEVAGFGDNLNRLSEAVGKMSALWLVETTEGNERLFLRALKREMAKSRLSKDARADEYRERYVGHFLRYTQAHKQPTPENLVTLEAEKDNLLGAMGIAFGMREWQSVMGMTNDLFLFLNMRGYWDEAIKSGEQGEAAARELRNEEFIAFFKGCTAMIRKHRGEYEEARNTYQELLEITKRLGKEDGVSACLHQLGMIAQEQGKIEEARRLYGECLKIDKKLGNPRSISATQHELGRLEQRQGNLDDAEKLYKESLESSRTRSDYNSVAVTLFQLGTIAHARGNLEEARNLYGESLDIAKRVGNKLKIACVLHSLGKLLEYEGNRAEATLLFRESLSIFKNLGSVEAEVVRIDLARVEDVPG